MSILYNLPTKHQNMPGFHATLFQGSFFCVLGNFVFYVLTGLHSFQRCSGRINLLIIFIRNYSLKFFFLIITKCFFVVLAKLLKIHVMDIFIQLTHDSGL